MVLYMAYRPLRRCAGLITLAALGIFATPAMATSTTDTVTGTVQSDLAIAVSTPATAFATNFQPGGTATSSGALTVTDTSATPTLTAVDSTSTSNNGHMQAAATGCTGSEAFLANPLKVGIVSATGLTGSTISLSGTPQTVATASAPVAAAVWNTSYSQTIGSTETMTAACVYNVTVTYTLS